MDIGELRRLICSNADELPVQLVLDATGRPTARQDACEQCDAGCWVNVAAYAHARAQGLTVVIVCSRCARSEGWAPTKQRNRIERRKAGAMQPTAN